MSVRTCQACGQPFEQFGRGRPAKRCPPCRQGDRYGPVHAELRANASSWYGQPCTRCGGVMIAGQPIEPDHRDGGGPHDYAGFAHASCNHRAGASNGNRMRAAAYRQMRGQQPASRYEGNGTATATTTPLPARLDPHHQCHLEGCHADGPGSPCRCGHHSRVW